MKSSDVVSKGEFAALCGVSPGLVSQWIAGRKISGEALVGEGRSAKIRVALAQRQLRLRRDVGQAHGNGAKTRLRSVPRPTAADEEDTAGGTVSLDRPLGDGDEAIDAAIKRAKLAALERANRLEAAEEAASAGRYAETIGVRRQLTLIAVEVMRVFEGALPEMASALAAEFQREEREVLQLLNGEFRKVRERAAETASRCAEGMPALVRDEAAGET